MGTRTEIHTKFILQKLAQTIDGRTENITLAIACVFLSSALKAIVLMLFATLRKNHGKL